MTRFEEFDDFRLSAPGVDWETIFCVVALLAFGTVMVFSATSSSGAGDALAAANTGELKRHLASIGLAGAAALVVYRVVGHHRGLVHHSPLHRLSPGCGKKRQRRAALDSDCRPLNSGF